MAEKRTLACGVEMQGILPPVEARERARSYWRSQLERAQKQLARADADMEVTYWRGATRLHPACEEQEGDAR